VSLNPLSVWPLLEVEPKPESLWMPCCLVAQCLALAGPITIASFNTLEMDIIKAIRLSDQTVSATAVQLNRAEQGIETKK
jgi:hypothetical protein